MSDKNRSMWFGLSTAALCFGLGSFLWGLTQLTHMRNSMIFLKGDNINV